MEYATDSVTFFISFITHMPLIVMLPFSLLALLLPRLINRAFAKEKVLWEMIGVAIVGSAFVFCTGPCFSLSLVWLLITPWPVVYCLVKIIQSLGDENAVRIWTFFMLLFSMPLMWSLNISFYRTFAYWLQQLGYEGELQFVAFY